MADTTMIDTDAQALRIEREFKAPMARVYAAFTDPSVLGKWWGPEGVDTPVVEMDVREGGAWSTVMRNAEGQEFHVTGTYVELKPVHRLAFTWGWVEDGVRGHETLVEIDLTETAAGTKLSLVHAIFESRDARDNHNGGWTSSLNCLAAVVEV